MSEKKIVIKDLSLNFSIRIVNLYKNMLSVKKEFVVSKQILKSGTSIGANISQAQGTVSNADFVNKLSIALKETYETEYWLILLLKTDYLNQKEYDSIMSDLITIKKILISIIKKLKLKNNK